MCVWSIIFLAVSAMFPLAATADNDDFYQPPAQFSTHPQAPGTVLRTQPVDNTRATKMLYASTDQDGKPVAVSGYVIEPDRPAVGTVVFAPGTRGQGDMCAPSKGPWLVGAVSPTAMSVNYELPIQYYAASLGLRVIVTDYIGLGTPGIHTYVNAAEEAHAVLDAARAGLRVAKAPLDSPVGLHGYSQGGGAVAAAAELAEEYAPDVRLVGTYAGAPPADLFEVFTTVDGSSISGVLGMAINGFSARDAQFRAAVDRHVSDAGHRYLQTVATSCVIDSVGKYGFMKSNVFTKTGITFKEVVQQEPVIAETLKRNSLGKKPPRTPIFMMTGRSDDIIPTDQVARLADKYCRAGATVSATQSALPRVTPTINSGINHALSSWEDIQPSMEYLLARFRGEPARNDCGNYQSPRSSL